MKLDLKFKENKQILDLKFGQIQEVSDGGFDRGYEAGFDKGYNEGEVNGRNEGYADGYLEGEQKGFENCLQRLEPIEITENGEYLPEGDSVGFSSVNVNLPDPENKFASLVDGSITEVTAKDLEGVTKIRNYAFYRVTSIENISIPTGVTNIEDAAFYNCVSLSFVEIPEGVISIGGQAFYGCSSIVKITIPESVTTIGSSALGIGSSKNKATIIFTSKTPPKISSNTFRADQIAKIIVPVGCSDAYKSATNWSNFADYIEEATE